SNSAVVLTSFPFRNDLIKSKHAFKKLDSLSCAGTKLQSESIATTFLKSLSSIENRLRASTATTKKYIFHNRTNSTSDVGGSLVKLENAVLPVGFSARATIIFSSKSAPSSFLKLM